MKVVFDDAVLTVQYSTYCSEASEHQLSVYRNALVHLCTLFLLRSETNASLRIRFANEAHKTRRVRIH